MLRSAILVPLLAALIGAVSMPVIAAAVGYTGADNPFARPSPLPYELPPFDRIHDADYGPALAAGMRAQLAQVASIARNPAPPTFDNTVVALERTGAGFIRAHETFLNIANSNNDDAILKLQSEMAPKLAAHSDSIHLNAALFARIETLYRQRARLKLDAESRQLLERYHTIFVRAGARLGEAEKAKLRRCNQQLSSLTTRFQQNVAQADRDAALQIDDVAALEGLSDEEIGAAQEAARARGLEGKWLIELQNTTTQPVLAHLRNRALRERIFRASIQRALGGASDNTALIAQIVKLRAERAQLLGFPSHAAYELADEGAHDVPHAEALLRQISAAALSAAQRDAAELQRLIDSQAQAAHAERFELQPWDWDFYDEQIRQQRLEFDDAQVKPYFELEHVLQDGVFYVAHELYGLTFKERHDLPVYHPDVRVFEVFDADGAPLALLLGDYYARENKQGGAWMDNYVDQSRLLKHKAVVVNNLNIPKPSPGAPTLLSFTEVTALFHEFGHALHGMLSNVEYPLLSGTNVPDDFVEYPSQFNEMWAREPQVVAHFAHHYQTGEAMPRELLDKVVAAQQFNQGYELLEYDQNALLDLAWHELTPQQTPAAEAVMSFESAALKSLGVDYAPVPPRYHSPYFLHIFSDEQYSAGYYAYQWSEVLARDTGQWLHQHGGITRDNGDILRARILSRGHTEDPQRMFRELYGGPPQVGPLLEYHGLN
jgi:peptidyl-dipeptidase Dcp